MYDFVVDAVIPRALVMLLVFGAAACQGSGLLPTPGPLPDLPPETEELWTPPLCHVELECDQEIVDEPKVPCWLNVQRNDGTTEYEGWAGVERRGRSSLGFPKPHLGVELWSVPEESPAGANLFDMGRDSDWILNGNYVDRSLIRNKLSFDLYQELGDLERYATETVLCELTLDDVWLGVFTLGERLKRDDDRVAIAQDPERLGRSFVVKNDDGPDPLLASPSTWGGWFLVYPSAAEAVAAELDGIRASLQAMEDAAFAVDPGGAETGLFAHLEIDSAVDWVLLQEVSKNNDAYFLSVYLWKDLDGRIHFAPWDHDLAWGGYPIGNCGPEGWVEFRPQLIEAMAANEAFRERLVARWFELREGTLSRENILARLHMYRDVIGEAGYANFEVWPMEDIDFVWDNTDWLCPAESWDDEKVAFDLWVDGRLQWMDANIDAW